MGIMIIMRSFDFPGFCLMVRSRNWWYAKIPPLLVVLYALLLVQAPPPGISFIALAGILCALCSLFSFGYVVNDIFDIAGDQRSGKQNAMAPRTTLQQACLCVLFVVSGFLPWLWLDLGRGAALLLAANYLLPMAYSIPPLRLKEKGVWGIVADATMVHALPTLFVAMVVRNFLPGFSKTSLKLTLIAVAWAFFSGLRGIVIHQLQDRESDIRAGVDTLAIRSDPDSLRRIGRRYFFSMEVLALFAMALLLFPFAPLVLFAMALYAAFDWTRYRTWNMPFDPVPVARGTYVTLADFNEVWLPLSLTAALAAQDLRFLVLPVLHIGFFYRDVKKRKYEVDAVMIELKKRSRKKIS